MSVVERVRRARDTGSDDQGFVLIFVLGIVTLVMIMAGSAMVIASSAIRPAQRAAYSQAADAAAQGGLQAFIAYLDATCPDQNSAVATCVLPRNFSWCDDTTTTGCDPNNRQEIPIPTTNGSSSASYRATYTWQAQKDPTNRYFRVKATGTVTQGGMTSTKAVVGDVVGGASMNILDYGVVTGFESQSSSTVLADWPERTISLNCAAVNAADVPIKQDRCASPTDTYLNTIHWSGASPGSAPGKVAICNATFDAKGGRSNNLPPKAPNPYVDWTEQGLDGNNYDNFQPCQTSWGHYTKLLAAANPADGAGGYYSNDALLLSNSYPGGTGPLFNQPVSTNWMYTTADAGLCSTEQGHNYRSFDLRCAGLPVEVGGTPDPSSTYPNVSWTSGPQLPTSTAPIPSTACVYNGPTRVVLKGSTALVTSPQTTSTWVTANAATRPAQCYSGATGTGMAESSISLTTPVAIHVISVQTDGTVPPTTPALAHGSSGWPVTGQRLGDTPSTTNSVFYLTNGTSGTTSTVGYAVTATPGSYVPATGDNPSTKSDGAWVPQWTSDTMTACTSNPAAADLRLASCFMPILTSPDAYSWLKSRVQSAIAANPANYTTQSAVQTLVNGLVTQGNSSDAALTAPTYADPRSHRWSTSVASGSASGCTASTGVTGTVTDTPISAPSTDALYASSAGNIHVAPSTDTSCYTVTVTAQVGTCNVALVAGLCVNVGNYVWGNGTALLGGGKSVAQFTVTFTVKKTTTTTTTTAALSSFPSMSDVTQYQLGTAGTFGASGPGDLYVEGTADQTMALVAASDLVLTGPSAPTNPTGAALELVARDNVRVYHPVKCADSAAADIAATSPGFCPNDITGLYTSVPAAGSRPDQQYVNMRADLKDLTIRAAVFALGNPDASITCPQPPGGGGVCGGEFTVDNYNRGASLGYLTEIGTLAMAHHAPVGQEWEITDTTGQSSRPWSGYELAQQYQNVKSLIAATADVNGLLQTTSVTSSRWHVVSVSTGTP